MSLLRLGIGLGIIAAVLTVGTSADDAPERPRAEAPNVAEPLTLSTAQNTPEEDPLLTLSATGNSASQVDPQLFVNPPGIIYYRQAYERVEPRDVPMMMSGQFDSHYISDGTTVVLDFVPTGKIIAPNTYRDGEHCYSGNVIHVKGIRIPVSCPAPTPSCQEIRDHGCGEGMQCAINCEPG